MKILLTGVAGFIGSHLLEAFLKAGYFVVGIDDLSNGKPENIRDVLKSAGDKSKNFECRFFDISDAKRQSEMTHMLKNYKIDVVCHQAAMNSIKKCDNQYLKCIKTNATGSRLILNSICESNCAKLIFASSSSIYGDFKDDEKTESKVGNALSFYAASKQMKEILALQFSKKFGIGIIGLRYFNVFGPRQKLDHDVGAVVPRIYSSIIKENDVVVYGNGEQTRDFTYVSNIVDANLLAIEKVKNETCEFYNIAEGHPKSVLDIIDYLVRITGKDAHIKFMPSRDSEVMHSYASILKAKAGLNYNPRVDMQEGLLKYHEYMEGRQ